MTATKKKRMKYKRIKGMNSKGSRTRNIMSSRRRKRRESRSFKDWALRSRNRLASSTVKKMSLQDNCSRCRSLGARWICWSNNVIINSNKVNIRMNWSKKAYTSKWRTWRTKSSRSHSTTKLSLPSTSSCLRRWATCKSTFLASKQVEPVQISSLAILLMR